MNKKLKVLIMTVLLILTSSLVVSAADATANLIASSKEVKPGGKFTVTLHCECPDGLNGCEGKLAYDETKIDLVEKVIAKEWSNLNPNDSSTFATFFPANPDSPHVTSVNMVTYTFKVKDNVKPDTTTTIKVENIVISTLLEGEQGTQNVGTKEVTVTVKASTSPETTHRRQSLWRKR